MALIVDFPDLAAGPPDVAVLTDLERKICEQLGGVMPDGTQYPGNLDLANLRTVPTADEYGPCTFRNEQKQEPYSEFSLAASSGDSIGGVGTPRIVAGTLPFDAVLVGFAFHQQAAHKGAIYLSAGERFDGTDVVPIDFATLLVPEVALVKQWSLTGLVAAGCALSVRAVFDPVVDDSWSATFFLKALHRRA